MLGHAVSNLRYIVSKIQEGLFRCQWCECIRIGTDSTYNTWTPRSQIVDVKPRPNDVSTRQKNFVRAGHDYLEWMASEESWGSGNGQHGPTKSVQISQEHCKILRELHTFKALKGPLKGHICNDPPWRRSLP